MDRFSWIVVRGSWVVNRESLIVWGGSSIVDRFMPKTKPESRTTNDEKRTCLALKSQYPLNVVLGLPVGRNIAVTHDGPRPGVVSGQGKTLASIKDIKHFS